jgi:hypothetical protein
LSAKKLSESSCGMVFSSKVRREMLAEEGLLCQQR